MQYNIGRHDMGTVLFPRSIQYRFLLSKTFSFLFQVLLYLFLNETGKEQEYINVATTRNMTITI